jgi:hypothetical protein
MPFMANIFLEGFVGTLKIGMRSGWSSIFSGFLCIVMG